MNTSSPPKQATGGAVSAREIALGLLGDVLQRRHGLDEALERHRDLTRLEPRDRGFARMTVATALRRLGQIDAAIAVCLDKPLTPKAKAVQDILRVGAAQLLFLETPAHAAVAETVDLATGRLDSYRGLINAVLRRLAREGKDLLAAQDAARLNTPDWLWQSWTAAYGEAGTRAIAAAHEREPPLDIAVATDSAHWTGLLDATILPTGTLRRTAGGAIPDLPGFNDGAWWVQDAAAALPARLLGDVRDKTVLDLCAAPGGKTAQLAAAGAKVTAVDRSATRLARAEQNLRRLGLSAELVVADAATWRPPTPADYILLDAPCSSTGTIRRHPDVAWLKTPEDVARLTPLQDKLLDAAVAALTPSGTLVYCVCSLQPEEGPDRIAAVLTRHEKLTRRPVTTVEVGGLLELATESGDLRTLPCHLDADGGMDGFYAARLTWKR
jgi:16S rRNA (cytosine967-C5)-methyltransferase